MSSVLGFETKEMEMAKKAIVLSMFLAVLVLGFGNLSTAATITVDFNAAITTGRGGGPGGDFDIYEEDGFRLIATWNGGNTIMGKVRINAGFTPTLGAHPNFGFDDQDILITSVSGDPFDFLSLEIYEAASYHPVGTLLVEGIREGIVVNSQVFETDGIAGLQEFSLSGFTNLDEIRLGGGASSEMVGVDNLMFEVVPEPATLLLLGLGGLTLLDRRR